MVRAVEYLRPMRGGAQAQLLRADDGYCYVVKFLNNPQHRRILVNEWLATSIAREIGLTVPSFTAIDVVPEFLATAPHLVLRGANGTVRPTVGPAFASRVPTDDPQRPIYDHLPDAGLLSVANLREFAGMVALDTWLGNCDGRQAIFLRSPAQGSFTAHFIDFGFCFNGGDWNFPNRPLQGLYSRNLVYRHVCGWESFDPWLSRIEAISDRILQAIVLAMPQEWVDDPAALALLIAMILRRRSSVRSRIARLRTSPRHPFPGWPHHPIPGMDRGTPASTIHQ